VKTPSDGVSSSDWPVSFPKKNQYRRRNDYRIRKTTGGFSPPKGLEYFRDEPWRECHHDSCNHHCRENDPASRKVDQI